VGEDCAAGWYDGWAAGWERGDDGEYCCNLVDSSNIVVDANWSEEIQMIRRAIRTSWLKMGYCTKECISDRESAMALI